MSKEYIQERYPESFTGCYGCGTRNPEGYHLATVEDGEETISRYRPEPHQQSAPGFVYGGLLASLLDCHAMATAAAAAAREAGSEELPGYVTAMLHVDFVRPTPLGPELEIRGRVVESTARKRVVRATVSAAGEVTVRAEIVAVPLPRAMMEGGAG
jgi:acyl-coenzyme A thioesterase PaaI-like protein